MFDLTNWEDDKIIELAKKILSDMDLWLKDIEFIKGCGEKCMGALCIYPDIDNGEDLPTFVKMARYAKQNSIHGGEEPQVDIISLSDIDEKSAMALKIKQEFNNIRNASYWNNQKARHHNIMINLDLYLCKK